MDLRLEHGELHGHSGLPMWLLRNNCHYNKAVRLVAPRQYERQPVEIQEARTKKTLAAFPREGSQSE
jgi:hypothetical protein